MEEFYDSTRYHFGSVDYSVFGFMLGLSALTGLYFGCKSRIWSKSQDQSLEEYLIGGRTLTCLPVAMSLVASYISGVTVLGSPTEIYYFGSQYMLIVAAIFISGTVITFVYLPVFCQLRVASSYEYLEMRFSTVVRIMASAFFVLDEIMFLPIIVYVPSLAFNQVTGCDIHIIGTIVTLICIFYTFLGGLKAVVWTDTWQIIAMFLSTIMVIIIGTIYAGGPGPVFSKFSEGGRVILFDFNTSMYQRYTFFSVLIGGFTYWTSFNAVNQTMVQRYMSLPNYAKARKAVIFFTIGVSSFVWLCTYVGSLLYYEYSGCDPMVAGRITAADQLVPLYVMDSAGNLSGIPGLFISGVFGASLSSLSVVLNSTAQVILEDIIKGCLKKNPSEAKGKIIVKTIVLILGAVALGGLYVVEHMGGVLEMATAFTSIAAGTTFGIFTLGMVFPWVTSKGAIVGALAGMAISSTITYGSEYMVATHQVVAHKLPVSIDDCYKYGVNTTMVDPVYPDESHIFPLFRLSYLWITPIGVVTVITVGLITTLLTGKNDIREMDPDLITPVAHWMLPPESQRYRGAAKTAFLNRFSDRERMVQEMRLTE